MKGVFDPFLTEDAKKIIENCRQVALQLCQNLQNNLSKNISLIDLREIKIPNQPTIFSGDIIYRPLENLKSDWNLDFNHYGIVFGTTIDGEALILDIASKRNVSIVPYNVFLGGHAVESIRIERKPKETSFETILKRAEELQFEMYSLTNLNCRHFVNYCVFGKKESVAVQNISNIVSPLLYMITEYLDLKANFQTLQKHRDIINNLNVNIKAVNNNIKVLK